jgi:uncharacterized protein DUF4190
MNAGLPAPPAPVPPARNRKAAWALVLGILGIWPLSLLASIPALILGYQAIGEIRRSGGAQGGRGMALAGVILGWISVGMIVIFIALFVAYAASCSNTNCG